MVMERDSLWRLMCGKQVSSCGLGAPCLGIMYHVLYIHTPYSVYSTIDIYFALSHCRCRLFLSILGAEERRGKDTRWAARAKECHGHCWKGAYNTIQSRVE